MNQFNWTYLADNGKRHHVGLLHGAKTGHLLVHCNSNIVLIDFGVLKDATYSIFIDDQLCEISIERKGDEFFYGFEINSKADTPLNRYRKKIEKKHMIQSMVFLSSLVVVILAAVYGLTWWNNNKSLKNLSSNLKKMSKEAKAKVLVSTENDQDISNYFFIVDGKSYTTKINFNTENIIILENGLPLEAGDEFIVTYAPKNPRVNKIDYNRPTKKQIRKYKERTIRQYQHLQSTLDSAYVACLVDIAFSLKGLSGLADIYFQNVSPVENEQHNRDSFGRLTRSLSFQNKVKKKCHPF